MSSTPIYRAPMRARDRDLRAGAGAEHGLTRGLVGIGGALEAVPATLEEAVEAAVVAHGPKAGRLLRRFAELPTGSFVWTRDGSGLYHLGRVRGPWRYDASRAAGEVGIHHVRAAAWLDRPFGPQEVPVAVAATFARGGRNFQRTHDAAAERRTAKLWEASVCAE
jgi:hypothetical protein